MQIVSITEARRRFGALLDATRLGPVLIRRQNRNAAVIMSAEQYERIRNVNAAKLQRFCDRVSVKARGRGLNATVLKKPLKD